MGGTVYSTINSAGYYARDGGRGAVAGFTVLTILSAVSLSVLIVV